MSSFIQFTQQLAALDHSIADIQYEPAQGLKFNRHSLFTDSEYLDITTASQPSLIERTHNATLHFIAPQCPVAALLATSQWLQESGGFLIALQRKRLPQNIATSSHSWVMQCHLVAGMAEPTIRQVLDTIQEQHAQPEVPLDIVAVPFPAPYYEIQLACFDMDSTLIEIEVIDELARHAGIGKQVSQITERAMRGELDFKQSFAERLALLKGLDASVIEHIKSNLPIMPGARELMMGLKTLGATTMIFSGGFDVFARVVAERLGMSSIFANTLAIQNGQLTGQAHPPIVDAGRKFELLQQHTQQLGLQPANTLAVGDGANDLEMLGAAGLGVAFHAKPIVRQQAQVAISHNDLSNILHLLA